MYGFLGHIHHIYMAARPYVYAYAWSNEPPAETFSRSFAKYIQTVARYCESAYERPARVEKKTQSYSLHICSGAVSDLDAHAQYEHSNKIFEQSIFRMMGTDMFYHWKVKYG